MKRAVVCVATTARYQRGMARLFSSDLLCANMYQRYYAEPGGCLSHAYVPYAFKAYALKEAADEGADLVLWADACVLPIRSLEPLWNRIETEGYWISRNGWTNYQWTADSAYSDLAGLIMQGVNLPAKTEASLTDLREINKTIPHVVATSFGLNLRSEIGKAFLDEYYRLASETRAFCGPWRNLNNQQCPTSHATVCGPADVLGHRHDQTAASVIAWRLGMKLTDPPDIFAYPPGDERTILLADGSYE